MEKRLVIFCFILAFSGLRAYGQYTPYFHQSGYMTGTWVNPAIPLEKTVNVSLASIYVGISTDGLAIDNLTSKNTDGSRYIDLKKIDNFAEGKYNLYFENDIRTFDIGIKLGSFGMFAGHGFRSSANMEYSTDLIKLLANGNGPYIGKTLDIGPSVDLVAYNELYLGVQKQFGAFSIGAKAKLLFGTAGLYTESSKMLFTTLDEYYQLQFENEYLIRSSSVLRYKALDDITLDYTGFTLDNFFYNNRGLAMDIGAHYQFNDHLSLSASVLDLGSIKWDFSPRKYESKGKFTFEGVDVINFIQDSTLMVKDTLLDLIDVNSSIETYTTQLNKRFILGGSYKIDSWSFQVLYQMQERYGKNWHQMSFATYKKISILDLGLFYTMNKNDFSCLGIYAGLKLNPVQLYVTTDNIIRMLSYERAKNTGIAMGLTLRF